MLRPDFLSCLLLLPLGACLPLLHREAPPAPPAGTGGEMRWADLAGGPLPRLPWGPSRWPRAPHPHALLVTAEALQRAGWGRAGSGLRFRRQEGGRGAAGSLWADGEKAESPLGSPLGTLAKELGGYSRRKGGFSFRFGRG